MVICSNKNTKSIYRSLIVISLTVVFGWFTTTVITFVAGVVELDIERFYVNLLAGLFVNFACATNFFVYYLLSKEYRDLFDEYLYIGRAKKFLRISRSTASPVTANRFLKSTTEKF
ncbi:hypothetical protein DICVIV_04604 [Dictyocaulus viviparus]|uniref:G-protein coupled receptors family 1 profile domain-containing protein n=1 Tax=Dictyocaulus viviparus TaxID=29172 RepID=A0A0D8XZI8_DICVI|nr:hypothetical protein DICVIV_04604 [Dictyocaulus viviparus]